MKGVQFKLTNKKKLVVVLEPLLIESAIEAKAFLFYIRSTEYRDYFLLEDAIFKALDRLNAALVTKSQDPIEVTIGEEKDAELLVEISGDKMLAELTVIAPYNGSVPSIKTMKRKLSEMLVTRGVSSKRLRILIDQASEGTPGEKFTQTIAKGLPAKMGRDSIIKPLVPNALERILAPQTNKDQKVDMRDFGEMLCVKPHQAIAKRVPPAKGRSGFTVSGDVLEAQPGSWKPIKLGDNAYISDDQENLIMAKVAGLPKYRRAGISVDDVFVSKGVNVATGNINYAGAVIVNGDVTENMKVVAKGDVTINGFVESAYIKSGGDIIVTQGASGKMQEMDCQLIAAGNIFLEHGQGLNLEAGKQINVIKQLAYSQVKCKENVIIGYPENPQGKLFASSISCSKSVIAGSVGAISGSSLVIDYSESFSQLNERFNSINKLFKDLTTKNANHEIAVSKINARVKDDSHDAKLADINKELKSEREFLDWLRISADELQEQIDDYEVNARVTATQALFQGVCVKLNNTKWEADKEYEKCRITLEEGKWVFTSLV